MHPSSPESSHQRHLPYSRQLLTFLAAGAFGLAGCSDSDPECGTVFRADREGVATRFFEDSRHGTPKSITARYSNLYVPIREAAEYRDREERVTLTGSGDTTDVLVPRDDEKVSASLQGLTENNYFIYRRGDDVVVVCASTLD